jgi:hypothetical protein
LKDQEYRPSLDDCENCRIGMCDECIKAMKVKEGYWICCCGNIVAADERRRVTFGI